MTPFVPIRPHLLALADDAEGRLLERPDRVEMLDAGNLPQRLHLDLDLTHLDLAAQ